MKKSFIILNWVDSRRKLEALGYLADLDRPTVHNDKGEDIWATAKDIFDNGLNVMFLH